MSNSAPDDPIGNKPSATRLGKINAVNAPVLSGVEVTERDAHTGTFDSILMVDGAGTEHILEGQYDIGNNNIVKLCYIRRHSNGDELERHYFTFGPTADINSDLYWKLDSVRAWPVGHDIKVRLAGHQIKEGPDFVWRKMGQGRGVLSIDGVWEPERSGNGGHVFPVVDHNHQTFIDVPPSSPFHDEIESLVADGIASGYDVAGTADPNDREFRPNNNVTRGQVSKMIDRARRL